MGIGKIEESIVESVVEAARDIGFIELLHLPKDNIHHNFSYYGISFQVPFFHDMVLMVEPSLASEFTVNVMGDDGNQEDMMKEILNIIAGSIMRKLYPHKSFEIGIPYVISDFKNDEKLHYHHFSTEDGKALFIGHQLHSL